MDQARLDNRNSALPAGRQGFVVLSATLIVTAISVAIIATYVLSSTSTTHSSLIVQQSVQARALADACAEEALQEIEDSTPYTGTDTISLGQGSCEYEVTNTGGTTREIRASGTVSTVTRRLFVDIDAVNPNIDIIRWQELASFP